MERWEGTERESSKLPEDHTVKRRVELESVEENRVCKMYSCFKVKFTTVKKRSKKDHQEDAKVTYRQITRKMSQYRRHDRAYWKDMLEKSKFGK